MSLVPSLSFCLAIFPHLKSTPSRDTAKDDPFPVAIDTISKPQRAFISRGIFKSKYVPCPNTPRFKRSSPKLQSLERNSGMASSLFIEAVLTVQTETFKWGACTVVTCTPSTRE